MSRRLAVLIAALVACGHAPPPATTAPAPRDPVGPHADAVAAQVKPYLDAEILNGVVVGLVDGDATEIYGFGARTDGSREAPDGRTVFELGSLTQTFTSLLLADAVARKEVAYDTALVQLMPLGVTVPTDGDHKITLEMLATHRSGLPPMPRSLTGKELAPDPFNGYDADRLYQDLVATHLIAVPGEEVHDSGWDAGLLGFALSRLTQTPYPELVEERIAKPLGLTDTRVDVPAQAKSAPGHNDDLLPVSPWHFDALVGTGGLHASARDLVTLVRAELAAAQHGKGPLADAMRATQEVRVQADPRSVALGWWVEGGRLWHAGASGGYHAFVEFDPAKKQGVIVLASTQSTLVDRLGSALMELLAGAQPPPATFPDPAALAPLAGRYQVAGQTADVVVRGKRVYLTQAGQPAVRLVPIGATEFWIEEVQAALAFEVDGGHATGLVIFVGGQRIEGQRVGDSPAPAPPPAK